MYIYKEIIARDLYIYVTRARAYMYIIDKAYIKKDLARCLSLCVYSGI